MKILIPSWHETNIIHKILIKPIKSIYMYECVLYYVQVEWEWVYVIPQTEFQIWIRVGEGSSNGIESNSQDQHQNYTQKVNFNLWEWNLFNIYNVYVSKIKYSVSIWLNRGANS